MFPDSEKDKDKKDDDGKGASIVSRLSLDNYFGMWRFIQNLLAGRGGDLIDANDTIYKPISSEHGIYDWRSCED